MVTLENVTKRYPGSARQPEFVAVRGVNLEVGAGEFMVLVGPSGCGKSTTLRMIAGLEDISAGTIRIDGRVVNEIAPKDRDIAMVFQNYALYPHLSVYDNMAFGLKLRGFDRREIERRVTEAAALLGLGELLPRKPKTLSGGQRQRVAVGRAIVRRPKVFLFDEPLSNLDAKMRVSMRAEIARLHQQLGATMIYVTHDQVEAMTMGTRICVMNGGGIVQVDRPLALYQQPANLFAAGFIGSPPMNFLRGQVETVDGRAVFAETNADGRPLRLALPERLARVGSARGGRAIVLGVRPEDITPGPGPTVCLDVVEPMGSETRLHANTGASTFIARVPPTEAYRAGTTVELTFNLDRAHLFDPETTLVLR